MTKKNKYLEDEQVKKNIDLFYNNKEKFLKEANEIQNLSFKTIIKETLKNIKNNKKRKRKNNYKSLNK